MKENKKIGRITAHIMTIGYPGNGKTRLLDNLLDRPRSEDFSTGVSANVVVADVTGKDRPSLNAAIGGRSSSWKMIKPDISFLMQVKQRDKLATRKKKQTLHEEPGHFDQETQQSSAAISEPAINLRKNVAEVLELNEMTSVEDLKSTSSLFFRDTGGQVEFQEVLTNFMNGPSLIFFVIKTHVSLDEQLTLSYRGVKGIIKGPESITTTRQALVQTLATIQCIAKPQKIDSHDSIVFIIGTHTDELQPPESKDKKILALNVELHKLIEDHNFSGLVEYNDRDSQGVLFPVSNEKPETKDFGAIRERVNDIIMNNQFFKVDYPLGYLLFSLKLQHCESDILDRGTCEVIAKNFNITNKEEITKMLTFLHHRTGLICYYDIDDLRDLVVKDPKVIFDKLTDLMVKTFPSSRTT